MGTTLGTGLILIGSMLYFNALGSRPVPQEILIGVLITLSTPVTTCCWRAPLCTANTRIEGASRAASS